VPYVVHRAFVFPSAGGDTAPFSLFSIEGTEIIAVIYPGRPG
jgi:surfactin synthase thioesterase subunit